jgi:hypothetical protein
VSLGAEFSIFKQMGLRPVANNVLILSGSSVKNMREANKKLERNLEPLIWRSGFQPARVSLPESVRPNQSALNGNLAALARSETISFE